MRKLLLILLLFFSACSREPQGLKIAATPVPHAEILEFIKPELAAQGINLKILVIDDYNIPNRALADGEVDANFFQHRPFLDMQIEAFGYPIEALAPIEIEPMGLYSQKIKSLEELKPKSLIAIPNDPSNEARALFLLQSEGLIELTPKDNPLSTLVNITSNPKDLSFIEVDAAMIPRALQDVALAAINTNFALEAGLSPTTDALTLENKHSPYANLLVIRKGDSERTDIRALKSALTSDKMRDFLINKYKKSIFPAF